VDGALTLSAWLYGDGGNDRLKGGGGNDALLGDAPGDLLYGGAGRNILIGTGGDRLVSNGGQDVLLAGSTAFDSDEVALAAILAEWSSADSLAVRVANLTGNTASPYFSATRLNGNYFLLDGGPDQTVSNDSGADTLVAGSGPGLVFAGSADKVSGLTASDVAFLFGP
jgi:Ca2+-binding RTX toxin-like protein